MNDFTASNGLSVVWEDEELHIHLGQMECLLTAARTSSHVAALREFFRAEADERLGRWRWPENPAFICHPHDGEVFVTDERDGRQALISGDGVPGLYEYNAAARAYFDAHPEPKPWHDAKPGEVWELTLAGDDSAAFYPSKSMPGHFTPVAPNTGTTAIGFESPLITAARRIWPGMSA